MHSLEWEELAPFAPEVGDLSHLLTPADLQALHALPFGPAVLMMADALADAMTQAENSSDEVMGLLLGRVVEDAATDRTVTLILASEPLHAAHGSQTRVHASAVSWQAAWPYLREDLPVIGWYHSHPGYGIFFSQTDRQSQRNYLSQPWQVGLVIDPTTGEAGAFLGIDSEVAPLLMVPVR